MSWLLLLFALLLPSAADAGCSARVGTTWTCTGDQATLKAFFEQTPVVIQEGDTVAISPCQTWDWAQQVIIGETHLGSARAIPGFTFDGGGESCTTFRRDAAYSETGDAFHGFLIFEVLASSGLTTITGFTLDGASSAAAPNGGYLIVMGAGLDKFRVHHVTINHIKASRAFVADGNRSSTGGLEFSGLFDHVTCNTVVGSTTDCFSVYGSWQGGNDKQFQWSKPLGNNHAIYVEDSVCNFAGTADDCTDGKLGGAFVFRYNTLNFGWAGHGADSTLRGNRSMEVYRNIFLDTPGTSHGGLNFRGGGDIAFDNTFHADYINLQFFLYRTSGYAGWGSFGESPARGQCNGASTWDGNLGSGTPADPIPPTPPSGNPGWPCLDQIGWYFPGPGAHGSTAQYIPAYYWRNVYTSGGANVPFLQNDQIALPVNNGDTWSTNFIVADRDYFTAVGAIQTSASSPFDGTTGVGFGTLARRPATCTTATATNALAATVGGGTGGVGYWATDQGSWNTSLTDSAFNPGGVAGQSGILYKCTATNTWTTYYTPYTYPHPLQGSAPAIPSAPTGLRTLGTSTGTTCTVTWAEAGLSGLVGYHLYRGTATGNYSAFPVINMTAALSAAAHQPPRQHTFQFPIAGTYYITVTGYSDSVSDTAAATEVTCVSTGLSRTAASLRGGH